jgi:hypothetical protein
MTGTQLRRLAIALVVAVFLWGLVEVIGRSGDVVEEVQLLPPIQVAEVELVTFTSDGDTVQLVRGDGERWAVNGVPASPKEVDALMAALAEGMSGDLVARNPESHARMEVDAEGAKHLGVQRGNQTLGELLVGAAGRAYRSAYARRPGADEVYLVDGEVVPMFDRSVNDWRDKRVVVMVADSIGEIEVRRGRARYRLVRADSGWSVDGRPTDSTRVQRLVDALASWEVPVTAFATPEQADSADFRRPERSVRVLSLGGTELAAVMFDSTDGAFWARRDGDATVYRIYSWKTNELTPADTSLLQRD